MKIFPLIICFITITAAALGSWFPSWPAKMGLCANPALISGFSPEKFFRSNWYHSKGNGLILFERDGSCGGFSSKIEGDKVEIVFYQYEPFFQQYMFLKGEARREFTRHQGLMFPVEIQLPGNFNTSIPFAVIGTDYDSWAVTYFCKQLLGFKIESAWVMTRDRAEALIVENMADVISSLASIGLKREDLTPVKQQGCGEVEPSF